MQADQPNNKKTRCSGASQYQPDANHFQQDGEGDGDPGGYGVKTIQIAEFVGFDQQFRVIIPDHGSE